MTEEVIETVMKRVERLLEANVKARNSYKWLEYLVNQEIARENGQKIFMPFDLFKKLPSPETISRCAREIQNKQKRFQPEEGTRALRSNAQKIYHDTFSPKEEIYSPNS